MAPIYSKNINSAHFLARQISGLASLYQSYATSLYEFPVGSNGDLRTPAVRVRMPDGHDSLRPVFKSHSIIHDRKPCPDQLPCFKDPEGASSETLAIVLVDQAQSIEFTLFYTIYPQHDALIRWVEVKNLASGTIQIESLMPWSEDLSPQKLAVTTLVGAWSRERQMQQQLLGQGKLSFGSRVGTSGHSHSPFIAVANPLASETFGEVYAAAFVYSGSHSEHVEKSETGNIRWQMGLNSDDFSWKLSPGEVFHSPEVIGVYSQDGFEGMSRRYHQMVREHLVPQKWSSRERPMLVNTWEADYFNVSHDKMVQHAKHAANIGLDTVVLDDGWFGERDDDRSSLGDWDVNLNKFPYGLDGLAEKLELEGVHLGLWVEPEMVSVNSNLYRAHPDWAMEIDGFQSTEIRHQLMLDLGRREVQDYLIKKMTEVFSSAKIHYVKWDMNRYMTQTFSRALTSDQQKEVSHRYVLGLYRVISALTERFPNIFFESCASGGGRFDLGMFAYMPQAWTSANTDAWSRMEIQWGTSFVFPLETMGSHVSASPNHQTGRFTDIETRHQVATFGSFGYEMNLGQLDPFELNVARKYVKFNKRVRPLIEGGDLYRLSSPFEQNWAAWMSVSKDKNSAVVLGVRKLAHMSHLPPQIKLRGLDPDAVYASSELNGAEYTGSELMHKGLYILPGHDFQSQLITFVRKVYRENVSISGMDN